MRHGNIRLGFHEPRAPIDAPDGEFLAYLVGGTEHRFSAPLGSSGFVHAPPVNSNMVRATTRRPSDGRIVAVMYNGDLAYSDDDGVTFTITGGASFGNLTVHFRYVCHWDEVNQLFLAGAGGGGSMAFSPDGITWTEFTGPSTAYFGPFANGVAGELLSLSGSVGAIWKRTLSDPTWVRLVPDHPAGDDVCSYAYSPALGRLMTARNVLNTGVNFDMWYSDDSGTTWTGFDLPGRDERAFKIIWDDIAGMFFFWQYAGTTWRLWYSATGLSGSWAYVDLPGNKPIYNVAAAPDGTIAVVGEGGTWIVNSLSPLDAVFQDQGTLLFTNVIFVGGGGPAPEPVTLDMAPANGALAGGQVGVAYNNAITASGGTGPYTYTNTGTLPPGVTLASDGTLSGTPTANGTFNFSVKATDTLGNEGTGNYSVTVIPAAVTLTVSPTSIPGGQVGTAYSRTITASGGYGSYTFARTAGTLPPGMTLTAGGVLSGNPTTAGTYNFTVTATDVYGNTGSRAYSVAVAAAPPVFSAAFAGAAATNRSTAGNGLALNVATGSPSAGRTLIVGIAAYLPSGVSITSVLVDGVAATEIASLGIASSAMVKFYAIAKPTGTAATITVNASAAFQGFEVGTWAVTGYSGVKDAQSSYNISALNVTMTVPAGGIALLQSARVANNALPTVTWGGATERYEGVMFNNGTQRGTGSSADSLTGGVKSVSWTGNAAGSILGIALGP